MEGRLDDNPQSLTEDLSLWYGDFSGLFQRRSRDQVRTHHLAHRPARAAENRLPRCINRINERLSYVTEGKVRVLGHDVYAPDVELIVQVRKNIGMVFQRPNPLPLNIKDNVLFGHRLRNPDQTSKAGKSLLESN